MRVRHPASYRPSELVWADYETDAIIQQSLRNELKDVTVITVAHRLQTIMDYDKIVSIVNLSPFFICSPFDSDGS